jgi:putative tricarboxylic transport membrane protein
VLIALSIIAAIRFRPARPELVEDGPHSAKNVVPQLAFCGALAVVAGYVVWDGMQWDRLTGIYPIVAGLICLAFVVPIGFEMVRTRTTATVFFDADKDKSEIAPDHRSSEYYLLWLGGMLVLSAFVGFVIGSAGFIYAFLRARADASHLVCAVSTAAFLVVLALLSHFMVLTYPEGLLQDYVTLPWPFR